MIQLHCAAICGTALSVAGFPAILKSDMLCVCFAEPSNLAILKSAVNVGEPELTPFKAHVPSRFHLPCASV